MQTTPITDLIQSWNRTADLACYSNGQAAAYRECARDLEALLPKLEELEVSPARRGDPSTSQEAARRVTAENTRGKMLLSYYKDRVVYQGTGLSAQAATRMARLEHLASPWKRVSELKRAGLIEPTGERVRGPRGQMQEVLALTDHGRAEAERVMPEACAALASS